MVETEGNLPLIRRERHGPVPMSDGQARLWFLDRLSGTGAQYNLPFAFRASGDLDLAALERSVAELTRRHEALRTNLCMHGTQPAQIVSNRTPTLELHDLAQTSAADVDTRIKTIAVDAAERPFDLEHDLLLRTLVIRVAERDHRLVFVLHHAVADGWSLDVLLQDLAAIYDAEIAGRPASLPPLPLQYADYAVWQQAWLQSDAARASLDYWRRQLSGAPAVVRLPWDYTRPQVRHHAAGHSAFAVNTTTADALLRLARAERITPFTVFLAALSVLLARYSRQTDIVIGTPVAARTRPELEGLVGFFVNMLPLRVDLSGEPTFVDVIARVGQTLRGAMSNQDVPFGTLVEALNPDRRTGWHPFFQVTFGLDAASRPRRLGPLDLVAMPLGLTTTKFDLNLWMTAGPRGVQGHFEYTTDLFDAATIERMTQEFVRLLEEVAADARRRVADVIAPVAERRAPAPLSDVARTASVDTLPSRVIDRASATPSAIALRIGTDETSYAQLSERMLRCARLLRTQDVPPGPIALFSEPSSTFVVGLLAILAAKRVCLPLDPRLTADAIDTILSAAGVSATLTSGACIGALPSGHRYLRIDDHDTIDIDIDINIDVDVESAVSDSAIACLLPWLEADGQPRMTAVSHRTLGVVGGGADTSIQAADRVAVAFGFANDVDGVALCRALAAGACAMDISPWDTLPPQPFARALHKEGVTVLIAGAERLERIASEFPRQLGGVRVMLANGAIRERRVGIANVPATLRRKIYLPYRLPGIAGPVAFFRPTDTSLGAVEAVEWTPIVVDEQWRPLGPGRVGELCLPLEIVSDTVDVLGSTHDRVGVTAAGAWCYRSGDLARLRADGSLVWCGAVDENGPIADDARAPGRDTTNYVAPRTTLERTIAEIWTQLLRADRIGVHDNFFVLGGYSLLATRMLAQVRHSTGLDVPLRQIFDTPTIAGLTASIITGATTSTASAPVPPLIRRERRDDCRASYAQRRLWFLDRLVPPRVYNVPLAFRVRGTLDSTILEYAVNVVVARHDSLRATFVAVGGVPMQRIAATLQVGVSELDLTSREGDAREIDVNCRLRAWAAEPFDLENGPLLRVQVLRLDDASVVLVTVHHIVIDAWSMEVLVREIGAVYRARLSGRAPDLAPVPLQYADFAEWQWQCLERGTMDGQLAYWVRQLQGVGVLNLPTDRPRPRVLSYRGDVARVMLPAATAAALRTLGHTESASLFMTLLTGFNALLHRWSGQDDIAIGTPISGRRHRDLDEVVGFFLNTVVIRTRSSGDRTFRDLVRLVRETTLEAFAQQDVPFDRVIEALAPDRTLSYQPLFQAMFVFHATPGEPLVLGEVDARPQGVSTGTAKFDLLLAIEDRGDALVGAIEYSTDLFDAATVERFAAHYARLLTAAAADPDRPIHDLPLVDEHERRELTAPQGRVAHAVDGPRLLHELFERQAQFTPDRTAIADEARAISYREVDARANRMARHLRREGVLPGAHVGICGQATPDTLVAILAILKTGAAYVPLDPDYPLERLRFMAADASLRVLVADRTAASLLADVGCALITVEDLDSRSQPLETTSPRIPIDPVGAAYVIYTSGSTGRPKGVVMPHAALSNLMAWQIAESGAPMRTVQCTSLSFDVSCQEIFATWGAGGTLVTIDPYVKRDPLALLATIERLGVERLFLPFVLLQRLAESAERRNDTLREIITAGEQLKSTPELQRWFSTLLPNARLINQYGPSEAHVVTSFELPRDPKTWPPLPPLGYAITNVETWVLDRWLHLAPIGVVGEIYLGGVALAQGYHQRPELTAERFVPDPISGRAGARLYGTGDLGRYQSDGTIEFVGRVDNQVKVRGYRIEPGEIEAALTGVDGVTEAVVVARNTASGDRRLVGYVLCAEGTDLTPAAIKRRLDAMLPDYMVPPEIVILPEWPLTATGKVDRARLPHPTDARHEPAAAARPMTTTEQVLSGIWSELLDARVSDAAASFFDLGGHSLLVTQMLARVRDRLGIEIPVRAVFEAPILEALGRVADDLAAIARPRGGSSSIVVTLQRGRCSPPFFCVHPATGSAMGYRALVDALGPDVTVHGIEAPADATEGPLATIEQIAAGYVDAVVQHSPDTHLVLGGWSVGGLIAFEMGRLLRSRGVIAAPVVLFDTFAPSASTETTARADELAEFVRRPAVVDRLDRFDADGAADGSAAERELWTLLRRVISGHGVPLQYIPQEQVRRVALVCARLTWAMLRFDPAPCAQPVVLFSASASDRSFPQHDAWARLAGGQLEHHVIGGDHYTLLAKPHVGTIAERLRAYWRSPSTADSTVSQGRLSWSRA